MSDQNPNPIPDTPTDAARRQWEASGARRSRAGYVVVALISLIVGAGIAWFAASRLTSGTAARAEAGSGAAPAAPDHAGGHTAPAAPTGAASKGVFISAARQQTIGVRTAPVEHRALETTIRTVGTIAYDETRVTEIHTKIAGWVERVFVDYVGKPVRRGQPLFTIYSPDLVATQNEYLLALKARRQLGESAFEETRSGAASLVSSARDRLRLWDISDAQVAALERTGQARRTLTLYSPFDGVILERNTFAGQYVTPEMSTVKIADLSTIWVIGQVFEYEMRYVRLGQDVQIEFPYGQSARTLTGKITFIYPDVDPQTRRARVRVEFRNPGLELKPDTYVTLRLNISGGHQLALPKEALIDTGDRRYALVAKENGYFEPREVEVGEPVDEYYPVLKGLETGERVVTSAQFLIDSETNLQAAMKAMAATMPGMDMGGDMGGMDMSGQKPGTPAPKGGDDMKGMDMGAPKSPAPGAPKDHDIEGMDMKDMPGMDMSKPAPPPTKKPDHQQHPQQ